MKNKLNITLILVLLSFPVFTKQNLLFGNEAESKIISYSYPRICPKSNSFNVKAGNQNVFAYQTTVGTFASFAFCGTVTIEIKVPIAINNVRIAPNRHGITPDIHGSTLSFTIDEPVNLLIEIGGMEQFFLFANGIDSNVPDPDSPQVHYFRSGQVYEIGELRLGDDETLYIEGGAIVRGSIRSTSANNVRIAGHGILDGSYYQKGIDSHRSILMEDCHNSMIQDIIMIEPSSWMIVLGLCSDVTVQNVKALGAQGSTDGCDIVGSKHIRLKNCFFRNGDDCIAVKSLDLRPHDKSVTLDYTADVEDIEISGCSFLAYLGGQALEIGHELRTSKVTNVRFQDCDILGVHGYGAAFGIHNADRATISDILYENIRVEHHYNKLLEFRILKSRWSKDTERGHIKNIVLRNIDVDISEYNPGYSCSIIGGWDSEHMIDNIKFENIKFNGTSVTNADEMDLYSKQTQNILFQ